MLLETLEKKCRIFALQSYESLILNQFFMSLPKKNHRNTPSLVFYFLLITIFVQLPYVSLFLLKMFPLFKLIQYGFRWNILFTFASAIIAAVFYNNKQSQYANILIGFTALITLFIGIGYFVTMQTVHWQYNGLPEHIDVPEYLPQNVQRDFVKYITEMRQHTKDNIIISQYSSSNIHIRVVKSESIQFFIDSSVFVGPIIIHRTYFPAWKLRNARGEEIHLTSDSLGRINAILPPSKEEYILAIEESSMEKIGKLISLFGLSILAILISLIIFSRKPKVS